MTQLRRTTTITTTPVIPGERSEEREPSYRHRTAYDCGAPEMTAKGASPLNTQKQPPSLSLTIPKPYTHEL